MRNKIKQLLNKEEGFTLVELLAVLAILALIVGIAIPMIGNVVTKAGTSVDQSQKELIINAAQLYDLEDGKNLPVTTKELIDAGYLENDPKLLGQTVSFVATDKEYKVAPTVAPTED